MSKARGSPLHQSWRTPENPHKAGLSRDQKAKIVFQLGSITEHLSRMRSDRGGSLLDQDGRFHTSTCLSRGLILNKRYTLTELPRGPFETERGYYQAQLSGFVQQAQTLPLDHHCFLAPVPARREYKNDAKYRKAATRWNDFVNIQSKIDSSENRTDYIIAAELLSRTITKWTAAPSKSNLSPPNQFAIHHPDLSVNNIYIDEDCNITCVIDWEFCSTVPLSMVLIAPGLPQSRDEMDPSLLHAFQDGFRRAAMADSQQDGTGTETALDKMLSCSRPVWLLSRILSLDSETDHRLLSDLWDLNRSPGEDMAETFRLRQSSKDYLALHRELKEEDQSPAEIARRERDYFRDEVERETVSRKLTLFSQWSSRYDELGGRGIRRNSGLFVADLKLWRWLNNCLES
ncbi:MAG: hypothetical protein Q9199_006556 [Rusavskia elegans]